MRKIGFALLVLLLGGILLGQTDDVLAQETIGSPGSSVYAAVPPDDSGILIARAPNFPLKGDGVTDDTGALHAAIAAAQKQGRTTIFLPEGTYRVSDTIRLSKGFRLIGYGMKRPTLVVAQNTPGWNRAEKKYVVRFDFQEGRRGNDTFYSGLVNVNIEIQAGNPAGIGIFYEVAQGCLLQDVDVRLADDNIGAQMLGSEIVRCRFFGGEYALTGSSWAWQVTILDSVFEGQKKAALHVQNTGPTMLRCQFRNMPVAAAAAGKGVDRFYAEGCRFENITETAFDLRSNPGSLLTVRNGTFSQTPKLLQTADEREIPGASAPQYSVERLMYGVRATMQPGNIGKAEMVMGTRNVHPQTTAPPLPQSDIPFLPPIASWKSVRTLGVVGDGKTDDTAALQKAIDTNRILFFPKGRYRVSATLRLRTDSVLIGLNPREARIVLPTGTPGFADAAKPRPIIETPRGGSTIFSGIGIDAGDEPGAFAVLWQGGPQSYLNDFWINWGENTLRKRSTTGLWVRGGGGIFRNLWIAHNNVASGLRITDTDVPGRVYGASVEHHFKSEILLENVRNWTFYALQTETTPRTKLPLQITNCRDLIFANLYLYRTSATKESPFAAAEIENSTGITFYNVRNYSNSKFPATNTVVFKGKAAGIEAKNLSLLVIP
jgi:hypothetical protein